MTDISDKIDKICNRLQVLLDEWVDTIPTISEASASTLMSQFGLYCTVMRDYSNKEEWALHDMAYLLMQTVSQLWEKKNNIVTLLKVGVVSTLQSMYVCLVPVLLKRAPTEENRLPEFLSLLSTLVTDWFSFYSSASHLATKAATTNGTR